MGKFICFDGLDGAGKTTLVNALYLELNKIGKSIFLTKEPTTSIAGQKFRNALKFQNTNAQLNHFLREDRMHHVFKVIMPALKKYDFVITDRYFYSHVFQSRNLLEFSQTILRERNSHIIPDVTFILSVSPLISLRRINSRGRIERLEGNPAYNYAKYMTLCKYPEVKVLNSTKPVNILLEEVMERIIN